MPSGSRPGRSHRLRSGAHHHSRRKQHASGCRVRLELPQVPRAIRWNGLMHHGELQPDRRLGEARQLDAHHRAALSTLTRHRGGRLVCLKPVSPVGQAKGGRLRRVLVRPPAPGQASVIRRQPRVGLPTLLAAAVEHDLDPGGLGEGLPKRRIHFCPVDLRDNHPSRPPRTHAAGFHVSPTSARPDPTAPRPRAPARRASPKNHPVRRFRG